MRNGLIVAGLLMCSFANVYAGAAIVFDPTNYAENLETALNSVRQVLYQVQSYATQIQQLQYQVNSLQQLNPTAIANALNMPGLARDYYAYRNLQAELNATVGSLERANIVFNQANRENAAANMTWGQWSLLAKRNDTNLAKMAHKEMEHGKQAMQEVNAHHKRLRQIEKNIKVKNPSLQKSLSNMNLSLATMAHQNQQILATLAQNQRYTGAKASVAQTDKTKTQAQLEKQQAAYIQAGQSARAEFNALEHQGGSGGP
jgi:conjugal transfer/entry exclusion protein